MTNNPRGAGSVRSCGTTYSSKLSCGTFQRSNSATQSRDCPPGINHATGDCRACFVLRSRSLLTVSTAAMLTDLGFFVFKIGTTEPMLPWVFGLAFGLALMAFAAYLEYQREGLLQQVRVFGRELKSWH